MKLESALKYMNAESAALDPALLDREVGSFAIDSREVADGSLFFALSQPEYQNNCFNGDFEDSTKYVANALAAGALAAVVRRDRFVEHQAQLGHLSNRIAFVDDVIVGLQMVAHGAYSDWNGPVVAITGSAGKTTAKELTAHVLEASGRRVLKNIKNYNNGLGHPLTVLNLAADKSYDVAVLEMGMSTPHNEIARLCRITPPDVAVELNVLPVHVEHLGSIENVAKAKAELVEGMKSGGTAVLNADDPRVASMHWLSKGRTITYGIDNAADVMARSISFERFGETRFDLMIKEESSPVSFPLNGRHNILNALAASAVGYSFGMGVAEIANSLGTASPPPQRGEILHFSAGFTVVNDSYNSNPAALISMARTLVEGGRSAKRRIVVAGEMLELGEGARSAHRIAGNDIAKLDVHALYGVRGLARDLIAGAEGGKLDAKFFESSDEAGDFLQNEVREGDLVLIKGSRGVKTERVLEKLLEKFALEGKDAAAG